MKYNVELNGNCFANLTKGDNNLDYLEILACGSVIGMIIRGHDN